MPCSLIKTHKKTSNITFEKCIQKRKENYVKEYLIQIYPNVQYIKELEIGKKTIINLIKI